MFLIHRLSYPSSLEFRTPRHPQKARSLFALTQILQSFKDSSPSALYPCSTKSNTTEPVCSKLALRFLVCSDGRSTIVAFHEAPASLLGFDWIRRRNRRFDWNDPFWRCVEKGSLAYFSSRGARCMVHWRQMLAMSMLAVLSMLLNS